MAPLTVYRQSQRSTNNTMRDNALLYAHKICLGAIKGCRREREFYRQTLCRNELCYTLTTTPSMNRKLFMVPTRLIRAFWPLTKPLHRFLDINILDFFLAHSMNSWNHTEKATAQQDESSVLATVIIGVSVGFGILCYAFCTFATVYWQRRNAIQNVTHHLAGNSSGNSRSCAAVPLQQLQQLLQITYVNEKSLSCTLERCDTRNSDLIADHNDVERSAACSICLQKYTTGCILRVLPCKHCFHTACIDQWLSNCCTCPLCRCSVCAAPPAVVPALPAVPLDGATPPQLVLEVDSAVNEATGSHV
jgi:hypothetical protein